MNEKAPLKPTLLIADDDEDILNWLAHGLFAKEDLSVLVAKDVDQAIEIFGVNDISVVLMDWVFGNQTSNKDKFTDGQRLLNFIRAKDPFLPVIVMSGYGFGGGVNIDPQAEAFLNGADSYLPKPLNSALVRFHIRRWIQRRQAETIMIGQGADILPIEDFDRRIVRRSLQVLENNKTLTAEKLQVSRQTVLNYSKD